VLAEPAQWTSGTIAAAEGCGLGAGDAMDIGDEVGAADAVADGRVVDWPELDEA
jgi:hypothetical protein